MVYYYIGGIALKYEMTIKEACNSGFISCLTPTDWIQLGAIIISLFSVLIALYAALVGRQSAKASEKSANLAREQLELNNQQRKDAVRPELFFDNEKFRLRYSRGMNLGRFNNEDNIVNLTMTNVGNGHAKKVIFDWDFDELSSSIELIKEKQTENQYIVGYKEGSNISFNESNITLLDFDFKNSIAMLSADENYKIHLPFSYTRILTIIIHLCYTDEISLKLIPNLKLSLTYIDVLGNECSQKFIFTPQILPKSSAETGTEVTEYELDVFMTINEVL